MHFKEAKEHAPGRLHALFAEPYSAFENDAMERQLHLVVALKALFEAPLRKGQLLLRVIHGWENGNAEPSALAHSEHRIGALADAQAVAERYQRATERGDQLPSSSGSLLATPLAEAIAAAEAQGQSVDDETRHNPAHWPEFARGLSLYTFFKVYHRLTYGEDDSYRASRCDTPEGIREIHEFHLEEGEFAIVTPPTDAESGDTQLILHESQLATVLALMEECLVAARKWGLVG
ncbi:hypothetical protein SAMN05192555_103177 [Franzmannia pantelleriensis]|uniref:Uncharacterized protein n=1 Tax=Franzmannia pantelleriensis TaxID=48727 RepID=A0A1G9IHH9_9GAMM|nr:hypothetical protein [Halomonas pantelleriensis]SDL24660.1 hypothetical protein SAMN05192555_103177 [Halomonas pantelleriensis]